MTTQGTPGTAVIKAELDGKSAMYTVTVDNEIAIAGKLNLFPADLSGVIDSSGITVTVEVDGKVIYSTTSDAKGQFEINDVPRGKIALKLSKSDTSYGVDNFDLSDEKGKRNVGNIWLLPISAHKQALEDDQCQIRGFGTYKNSYSGSTWAGEWRVLDRVDNKTLVISTMILFDYVYSSEASTWDGSLLKAELNGSFYNETFKNIQDSQRNAIMEIDEGMGRVFVLSAEEVEKYLPNAIDRQTIDLKTVSSNTEPSYSHGWWLRSVETRSNPSFVSNQGAVHAEGDSDHKVGVFTYGVRPAMWISLGNYH